MNRIDTPYEQIDFDTIVDIGISNAKIVDDKLFGPVYTRFVKKFAIQFEAERLGEEPPLGSDEWDWPQVKDYLRKNLGRYPRGFGALLYAMARTEAYLAGTSGVVRRITVNEMAKAMNKQWKSMTAANSLSESSGKSDIGSVFKQIADKLVAFKVIPPGVNYSVADEKTVRIDIEDCAFTDVCSAFQADKVVKYTRTRVCALATMICSYYGVDLPSDSDYDYDYNVDNFANPKCVVQVMKKKR
nr:hypothetical protein [Candidatus Freyarchaeota archaeon]